MKKYNVVVVGATGAVGIEFRRVLIEKKFPIDKIKFLGKSTVGQEVDFGDRKVTVEPIEKGCFEGYDIALFSAGGSVSKEFAPIAAEEGCVVIDNSSAWRMDPEVPLVVPEVNPDDALKNKGIIANPNCSTIQMCVALYPIHRKYGIKRLIVSTYQAASGAGAKGMNELLKQANDFVNGNDIEVSAFQHQLLFNVIPHIDVFQENGFTKEEMKMVKETKKIFHDDDIKVSATTVRVPVLRAHSESITVDLEKDCNDKDVRDLLESSEGIVVIDDPSTNSYPMPFKAAETFPTYVGRIRKDPVFDNGLSLWVVADQVLKGAALNAVQIAEILIEKNAI